MSDLIALAELHGVSRALSAVGITDDHDVERALEALGSRADGNPLYARSLARGLVSGLGDGTITSTVEWIADAPAIAGDIAVYYAHLYKHASVQAQAIADLIAVIDFSVTENELREMLPAFVGAWVPLALAQLVPVLTAVTGQGGVRIFHESFRRFMIQELARSGRPPAAALAPVVEWLAKRGFYEDARAYRFLLPALIGNPRLASKVKALAGVLCAVEDCSDAVAAPMRWWMTRNAHFTSIMLVLETLANAERPPFSITKGLEDVMRGYAECDIWGLRRLAVNLLERAGCSVTDIRHNVSLDDNGADAAPLDPTEQATLLSTDIGSVLDSLVPLWPELPERIARRLRKLVGIEGHRKWSSQDLVDTLSTWPVDRFKVLGTHAAQM
ncbi:MAG TPA: hypothetical protein VFO36_00210, partial [Nitrospiraceae bacterium]|nr:hypothetical protein [Nitrospiraceae bacterium]